MTNKPEMALVMARAMFGFDEDDTSARRAAVLVVRKGLAAVRDVECCEEVEDFDSGTDRGPPGRGIQVGLPVRFAGTWCVQSSQSPMKRGLQGHRLVRLQTQPLQ